MLRYYTILGVSAIAMLSSNQNAYALGPASLANHPRHESAIQYLIARQPTLAPFAFVKFCRNNPADCAQANGAVVADLTAENERELRRVNTQVNRSIRAVADADKRDSWQVDVAEGDCEDFVLTKRRKLVSLGWSPRALRIAVARTASGEGHAVLVVKTSKGDLVLDNRTSAIRLWRRTDLRWIKIQSVENPRVWHSL